MISIFLVIDNFSIEWKLTMDSNTTDGDIIDIGICPTTI